MTETAMKQTPGYPPGASPEEIWAILREVIEQTGDTVKITIPEGFTPREW